ncbi:MAG: YecA family protein [Acidimicrobiales bacterium]
MNISWVTIDRFCEEEQRSDDKLRRALERNDRPLRSSAWALSDEDLLEKLGNFGLDSDRSSLEALCQDALSAEEVARSLIERCGFQSDAVGIQGDWIWICLVALWERWWPDKVCLELLDDKVQAGYHELERGGHTACAKTWLAAWSDVVHLCDATGIGSIEEFDQRFPMTQSLYNWSQDLQGALLDAGLPDREVLLARARVCDEALRRFPHEDRLMTENRRRALAESYFELGETDKGDELFASWLSADPSWGFGWVAWAVCHFDPLGDDRPADAVKAERLLRQGYATPGVRDREAIAGWLAAVCERSGRTADAQRFRRAAKEFSRHAEQARPTGLPVSVSDSSELGDEDGGADDDDYPVVRQRTTLTFGDSGLSLDQLPDLLAAVNAAVPGSTPRGPRVGRNAPCPCGSGQKFKRCCGAMRLTDRP